MSLYTLQNRLMSLPSACAADIKYVHTKVDSSFFVLFCLFIYHPSSSSLSLYVFVSLPSVCTTDIKYRGKSAAVFVPVHQLGWAVGVEVWNQAGRTGRGDSHFFWNATAELMILCTVWPPITWQHKNDSTGMKYWSNTSTVCTSRYL